MDSIKKRSLADEAYERIKEEIISEKYQEGSIIPSENQLSKKLNVSRVVVREALSRLREENIIVTYQGKGSYRANPVNFTVFDLAEKEDIEMFAKVMEFRSCIETFAIKTAVKVATDLELINIKACAERMALVKDDYKSFTEIDYVFHLLVLKASHNELFVQAIENKRDLIKRFLNLTNGLVDSQNYAIDLHKKIADYLCQRNSKKAIELLKNNGEYNVARMTELIENQKRFGI